MSESAGRKQQSLAERRRAERLALDSEVTVRFEDLEIVGPGQNISETGVYFVAEAQARVRVLVEGLAIPRPLSAIWSGRRPSAAARAFLSMRTLSTS